MSNYLHRTKLPSPMIPRDQVSIWSLLKNCIGKELSKITMPVVFNEPLTMLQRACEGIQYSDILMRADLCDDPAGRMELICAYIIAQLSANCHRIIKPFNPLLYETYEYTHELENGEKVQAVAQQVSHHPPITAVHYESKYFINSGSFNPKIKFWGRSVEVQPDGQCRIYLKSRNETYVFKTLTCSIHNVIVGKLWFEHSGPLDVKCIETNVQAHLVFKQAGWFSNELHRFSGIITKQGQKKDDEVKLKFIYGKWSDYIKSVGYSEYEQFLKVNQFKNFKIPDVPESEHLNGVTVSGPPIGTSASPQSVNNNCLASVSQQSDSFESSDSIGADSKSNSQSVDKKSDTLNKTELTQLLDIPNSRTLWKLEEHYLEEYYNFTQFTMRLNELTPDLEKTLAKTDSRFRRDVRKLEEGDLDSAASEKERLEDKQREARAKDKRFKDPSSDFLWFKLTDVPDSKEKLWVFIGDFWEKKCDSIRSPDLF